MFPLSSLLASELRVVSLGKYDNFALCVTAPALAFIPIRYWAREKSAYNFLGVIDLTKPKSVSRNRDSRNQLKGKYLSPPLQIPYMFEINVICVQSNDESGDFQRIFLISTLQKDFLYENKFCFKRQIFNIIRNIYH